MICKYAVIRSVWAPYETLISAHTPSEAQKTYSRGLKSLNRGWRGSYDSLFTYHTLLRPSIQPFETSGVCSLSFWRRMSTYWGIIRCSYATYDCVFTYHTASYRAYDCLFRYHTLLSTLKFEGGEVRMTAYLHIIRCLDPLFNLFETSGVYFSHHSPMCGFSFYSASHAPLLLPTHLNTSHHTTSHLITSHHITSHHITSHHITSHHIR